MKKQKYVVRKKTSNDESDTEKGGTHRLVIKKYK